jgi:hypothetical protein
MKRDRRAEHVRNAAKQRRIDLGLAVSALSIRPGECRGVKTLAKYCDCSPQAISLISAAAIAKIRRALRQRYGISSTNPR